MEYRIMKDKIIWVINSIAFFILFIIIILAMNNRSLLKDALVLVLGIFTLNIIILIFPDY